MLHRESKLDDLYTSVTPLGDSKKMEPQRLLVVSIDDDTELFAEQSAAPAGELSKANGMYEFRVSESAEKPQIIFADQPSIIVLKMPTPRDRIQVVLSREDGEKHTDYAQGTFDVADFDDSKTVTMLSDENPVGKIQLHVRVLPVFRKPVQAVLDSLFELLSLIQFARRRYRDMPPLQEVIDNARERYLGATTAFLPVVLTSILIVTTPLWVLPTLLLFFFAGVLLGTAVLLWRLWQTQVVQTSWTWVQEVSAPYVESFVESKYVRFALFGDEECPGSGDSPRYHVPLLHQRNPVRHVHVGRGNGLEKEVPGQSSHGHHHDHHGDHHGGHHHDHHGEHHHTDHEHEHGHEVPVDGCEECHR
eukprot:Rmarinus@m.14516